MTKSERVHVKAALVDVDKISIDADVAVEIFSQIDRYENALEEILLLTSQRSGILDQVDKLASKALKNV